MSDPNPQPASAPALKLPVWVILCLVVHVAILGTGGAWAAFSYQQLEASRQTPVPNNEPRVVAPQYDRPQLVSDSDLQQVLHKLRPRLRKPNPQVNHLDHALRFWGLEAKFEDPECYSGVELRDMLVDYRQFSQAWQKGTKPLWVSASHGLRARTQAGLATSSHVDHTLACLSEVGTPLDFPIITANGERTLGDLYRQAFYSFSLNQTEYEWSTLSFALFAANDRAWNTTEGQRINFDLLVERLMRQAPTQGVCAGNHRLHTLAIVLRINDDTKLLSDEMRDRVVEYLKGITAQLVANQQADGFWELNWDGSVAEEPEIRSAVARRILATGHALEWWAFAPESVLPPEETLSKATTWLVKTIQELSDREVETYYTFLSHAGRSLALWRGKFPAQAYKPEPGVLQPQQLETAIVAPQAPAPAVAPQQ